MIYLTGTSTPASRAAKHPRLGALCTPENGVHRDLVFYPWWAADNGCFTLGDRFDADKWLRWLGERSRSALFAAVPDRVSGAQSADGNILSRGPRANWPRVWTWITDDQLALEETA